MLRKYSQTISLELNRLMEYRINFLLRMSVNILVPLAIKIYLWNAVFAANNGEHIGSFNKTSMFAYQIWGALFIFLIEVRTTIENVAQNIRLGRITPYLLYPITMFEIVSFQFVAGLLVQMVCFVVALSGVCLLLEGFSVPLFSASFWLAIAFALLGSVFWFLVHFVIGIFTFWLDEIWTFFVLFQFVARFLSGNPVPLSMFPAWCQDISQFLPFEWLFYRPVMLTMGQMRAEDCLYGLGVMLGWNVILVAIFYCVWRRGLRRYSAAGM